MEQRQSVPAKMAIGKSYDHNCGKCQCDGHWYVNAPAIGNAYSSGDGNTTIRITGGTVNAINSYDDNKNLRKDYPAIGAKDGKLKYYD